MAVISLSIDQPEDSLHANYSNVVKGTTGLATFFIFLVGGAVRKLFIFI